MRALLWQGSGEASEIVREVLRGLFGLAGIEVDVVYAAEDLLTAVTRSRRVTDNDILVIDCFYGEPSDIDRCAAVVTHTTLSVHIMHPREQAIRDLEEVAGRPLVWWPADATIPILLDKVHMLRALRAAEAAMPTERPALTPREREVAALVADGHTTAEIAAQLHITADTVKSHVRTIMQKFGVTSRREFGRVYRADG